MKTNRLPIGIATLVSLMFFCSWSILAAGVDHFAWSTILSPQLINQSFSATITAKDASNATVTNFTGTVSLQCLGSPAGMIEDFESGVWPHTPWVSVSGTTLGSISSAYAHDGNYGLSDPDWMYRTDVSVGKNGDSFSWWVRPGSGRAYLGFGASSTGCWSIVAAPNTSQFMLDQNSGYGFTQVVINSQTWQAGKWYKIAVQFSSPSHVTCNLYDSDGATLLNTLNYSGVTGLPGGIAIRSFGSFALDTIASGSIPGSGLPMSPTNTGNFVNGSWSGNVAVLALATNVVLHADDGSNHTGNSNPFNVNLANDLSISIAAAPNPVPVGSNLTYTITVTNSGPSNATGVTVTNTLPANISFVTASSSQGACSQSGGIVTCSLGIVPGGANATVSIVVAPTTPGTTLTNTVTVSRAETDPYLGNNTATNVVAVEPGISIADTSMPEGNVGTTKMIFAASLNAPATQTITVNYATSDGIAIAGKDYVGTNGTLTFAPGVTTQSVSVAVIGNTIVEPNKTFFVTLSNPTNATLGRSQAVGDIINDDGLPGQADHFTWSVIPSPQLVGTPFTIGISALDISNNPATNFNGSVTLSAAGNHGVITITPTSVGPFTAGQWAGTLTVNTLDSNIVVTASDNNGHFGGSNPFYMIGPGSTFIPAANRVDMVQDSARGLLYITDGNQVLRYDLNAGTFLAPFVFGTSLCGIDISPDNNTLVVADTSAYNGSNVWVYVVDLPTGTNRVATFSRAFNEGGPYAVAFGYDGAAVITSTFLGSGWVPMRRYDPVSGNVTTIANPRHNSMVSSSGDGHIMGVAEADISSGPLDRYDVTGQTVTGSVGDGWFNFEVGVNRDGSQFAVPTYGGTFIYDGNLNQIGLLGTYASEGPIGLAYDPQADLVFFAWWPTSFIRVYETHTLAQVAQYDTGYSFGWVGNGAFQQGRVRTSRDGNNIFVTVANGVRWISRPNLPPADLAVNLSVPPGPVNAGNNLTYTIAVSNAGPNSVSDAKVFDRLPAGVTFVSASSPQGICTQSNGLVTCALNSLADGGNATISVVITPPLAGILTNTAAVYSSAGDPNSGNNFAVLLTTVHQGILGVTPVAGFTASGPRGGPFVPASQIYQLTNSGDASLSWIATNGSGWLDLSPTSGVLPPGGTTNVTVSIDPNANILPRGLYTATIGFTNITSGRGNDARSATLTVNTPPVALPQTVTLPEDGSIAITLQGTDADSDPLTASITALPAHGVLYQTSDGTNAGAAITSVPTAVSNSLGKVIFGLPQHGYGNGYGNFQFKVNDGLADSGNALVTVNVTHVNHPPVAVNDSVSFMVGIAQVSFNVLNNDSDPDNDPLTVQSFTLPARGTLTQINNGQFSYQPNAAFTNGLDQFSYAINDGKGGTATAQVTIKACTQFLAGGDWPTFGNGPSHTGYYPAILGGSTFVAGWSTNFGSALNQVAVAGGDVFVTPVTYFGATFLTALKATSGQQAWQYNFPSVFSINPPTYDNGSVYVQLGQGTSGPAPQLCSLNASNGALLWSSTFGAQWERYYAPTVVGNGVWVDGGYYGGMYGFGTNGSQWFFYNGLQQYDQWTPTYYQGTVYTWVAGEFRAQNPLTGAVLWMASFGWNWDGWSMNTVSAIDGGRAFVQQRPNMIAIDLNTHTNAWTVTGGVKGSPAVDNGIVYAIIGDGVQAFSSQSGAALGTYEATNDTGVAWQPIVTDDALFVSSSSATYVFDLPSHQLLQTIPFGGPLSLANGWLYIAGQDGWLRSYYATNYLTPNHLAWSPVPSQQFVGVPFAVTIQVQDSLNDAFTNFNRSVFFSSTNGIPVTPAVSGSFIQGAWTGTVEVTQPATNLVLQADDGLGQFGLANPINVASLPALTLVTANQSLQITWPVNPPGFILETSPDMSPGSWVPVTAPPLQIGDHYLQSIQTPGKNANAFYRLRFAGH